MYESSPNWSVVMTGMFALIDYALKFRNVKNCLPTHQHMMTEFRISYEVADHVLVVVNLFNSKEPKNE